MAVKVGVQAEFRRVGTWVLMLAIASMSVSPHKNMFPTSYVFVVQALTLPQSMVKKITKTGYKICTAR